jgi:hypothetical protein
MPLPIGTEPLVLADGTKINPLDGNVIVGDDNHMVEVPNTTEIQREIVASRKRIVDLPVPPEQMNTLSIVLCYAMFGIGEEDIANITHLPVEQVRAIKMTKGYGDLQEALVESITNSDIMSVRDMFVDHSRSAANIVVNTMNNPEIGINTRMSAANNVLDRAGHRPVDVVEHRHRVEGGLKIEYVKKEDQNIPTIDITPEGVM